MAPTKKTIGIVGGGQLGRMLTIAAHKLGFKVIILDPTPNSPAGQVADEQIVGSFKDKRNIVELGKKSDFITFEIESADLDGLKELVKMKIPVNPSPKILAIIKDKFQQKVFLSGKGIPVAPFALVESEEDCVEQGKIFGYPYLLKARFDAYDGRGNYVVKNKVDIKKALAKLGGGALYAEKFVPFVKELAVVSARDSYNKIISYPVVETIHKNNICHIVESPASVDVKIFKKAKILATKVQEALAGIGVFAVEMFLTKDGNVIVNEIAPRVHNSGHHTIEAFSVSQFEEQIRAIAGLHVVFPKPASKASVMVNILGARNGPVKLRGEDKARRLKNVNIHIYGKMETRKERKMGHLTAIDKSLKIARTKALKARKYISI
jgi:phosphoribosylaminoimidazole carboxylase PurK protein